MFAERIYMNQKIKNIQPIRGVTIFGEAALVGFEDTTPLPEITGIRVNIGNKKGNVMKITPDIHIEAI